MTYRSSSLADLETALATTLASATSAARSGLRRLAAYRAPSPTIEYPTNRLAAVLVLLHLGPKGELSVTLTTRSKHLRSHPGETALPGGRWEEGDGQGGEWTALREAHEEIGLPLPPRPGQPPTSEKANPAPLLYLTTLPAYSSRTLLVVLPIVYLLVQPPETASTSCLPSFLKPNPDEVDAIFHLPLRSFLMLPSDNDAAAADDDDRTEKLSHTHTDYTWLLSRPYRLHSFSTLPSSRASDDKSARHSAVTGLTADIVLDTALLAYYGSLEAAELPPKAVGFERRAQGQMEWHEIVAEALGMQKNAAPGGGGGKTGDASRETGLGAKLNSPGLSAADERTSAA